VRTAGPHNIYVREGQEGRKLQIHFCPECGSSVYWYTEARPDLIGVAVGALPTLPFPSRRARSGRQPATHGLHSRMTRSPSLGSRRLRHRQDADAARAAKRRDPWRMMPSWRSPRPG
jgi:hypothetical protein